MAFFWVILGIFFVWLLMLTILFVSLRHHYHTLTDGVEKKTLEEVLSRLVKESKISKEALASLRTRCATIEESELSHIQRIGLVRFNPFKDTGGDQSFILSLIDAKDNGVVITALYSRSGTRWYAKRIVQGKGAEHELSEEEKKALILATASK
jgi:hypothetical protein